MQYFPIVNTQIFHYLDKTADFPGYAGLVWHATGRLNDGIASKQYYLGYFSASFRLRAAQATVGALYSSMSAGVSVPSECS